MKFEFIETIPEDIAGKDDRKDLKITNDQVKVYDNICINSINQVLEYYNEEIDYLNYLMENIDNGSMVAYIIELDDSISKDDISVETYKAIVIKTLADLQLSQTLGCNIMSSSLAKELDNRIGFLLEKRENPYPSEG